MSVYAQDFGYFFNSNNSDRKYSADSFEEWLRPFFVSGVFTGGLQVLAQSTPDMTVKVTAGYANLNSKLARWTSDNTMTLETASGVYSRIDTIVLRRDNGSRTISIEVVTGTASASPQATAPTRTADIYELVLAEIFVGTGVTEITQANITDKRPDTSVCGYVVATVQTPDFSELYAQFTAQMEEYIASTSEDFDEWIDIKSEEFAEWFEVIKGQLDEDAAGHLQNEVDDLATSIAAAYNPALTYQEGDICTRAAVLYKRKSWGGTTPAAEAWDADHWDAICVIDELNALSQDVANCEQTITIIATGDTHRQIGVNGYVYVKEHTTLPEGLYKNTSGAAIPGNAPLSTSNLLAIDWGGLNDIQLDLQNFFLVPSYEACTNLNGIKTYLTGVFNTSPIKSINNVAFSTNNNYADLYFIAGGQYAGKLNKLSTTDFSCSVIDKNGNSVDIGYANGTWSFSTVMNNSYTTSGLSYTNCSYIDGGYSKVGDIVIVNIRIKVTAVSPSISGFPSYRSKTTNNKNIVSASIYNSNNVNETGLCCILKAGSSGAELNLYKATVDNEYAISTVYICG